MIFYGEDLCFIVIHTGGNITELLKTTGEMFTFIQYYKKRGIE